MISDADRNCFVNHKALYVKYMAPNGWGIEWLQWRDPNSSFYAMWFVRMGPFLFVSGDVGEATFQWGECNDLEFIAGCDLDYFAGKCRASEHGAGFQSWDEHRAGDRLTELLSESSEMTERFEERNGWRCLYSRHEWDEWAANHAEKVFGQDWWDSSITVSPGMGIDPRCELMLEGLKMAVKAMKGVEQCPTIPATTS